MNTLYIVILTLFLFLALFLFLLAVQLLAIALAAGARQGQTVSRSTASSLLHSVAYKLTRGSGAAAQANLYRLIDLLTQTSVLESYSVSLPSRIHFSEKRSKTNERYVFWIGSLSRKRNRSRVLKRQTVTPAIQRRIVHDDLEGIRQIAHMDFKSALEHLPALQENS